MTIDIERLVLGDLGTNCWLVSDGRGGPVIVIDPAGDDRDATHLLETIDGRNVSCIVLTHAHFDHLGNAGMLAGATQAPIAIHEADAARITSPAPDGTGAALFGYEETSPAADRILRDGDIVVAGELALKVCSTPGHTKGSISLTTEGHVFAGDTVFAGSVGRTDFPGGDAHDLARSIAGTFAPLDDATVIHPGHGPDTTVGRERRLNPFFPRT